VTEFVALLESLPPGLLYGAIAALAGLENLIPPLPADTAVALGALLAGRGFLDARLVFGITWAANVGSGAAVYLLARRYGRPAFRGGCSPSAPSRTSSGSTSATAGTASLCHGCSPCGAGS